MARSITISSIARVNGTSYITVGKRVIEIPGGESGIKDWIRAQFPDADESLLALGLAAYLARDPNMTNPGIIVGKTLTLDLQGRLTNPDAVLKVT
jgi:hypothetical protein